MVGRIGTSSPGRNLRGRSPVPRGRYWARISATDVSRVGAGLRVIALLTVGHVRRGQGARLVRLTDGQELVVRMARADDAEPLLAMHSRCSPESRYLRYLATTAQPPASLLPVLLGLRPGAVALVAETRDSRLVGLANLIKEDDNTGEVALLVEDSWQGRGLGTELVRRLVAVALDRGLSTLVAVTLRSNGRPVRVLARAGLPVEALDAGGLLELRAHLPNTARYPASSPEWTFALLRLCPVAG